MTRRRPWVYGLGIVFFGLGTMTIGPKGLGFLEREVVTSPLVGAIRIDVRGQGRVVEKLRTGSYAYLRLDSLEPGEWLVVSGRAPAVGVTTLYRGYAEIRDFESPSIGRRFSRVIFSSTHPQKGKLK